MRFRETVDCNSQTKMGPRDFIELAALGATARDPAELQDIHAAIDDIVGHLWMPVAEVVAGAVADLVRADCLSMAAGEDHRAPAIFAVTDEGRQRFNRLLAKPVDCLLCPSGQVGLKLKLAFIDLAPEPDQRRYIENIVCAYERHLAEWSHRCAACPRQGELGRMWREAENDRLLDEINLLRNMAGVPVGLPPTGIH